MDDLNLNYETLQLFSMFDVFAVPFTLGVLYLAARYYFNRYEKDNRLRPYFFWCFFLKMLMLLIYAALVQFYWGVGDTKGYYIDLIRLQTAIKQTPELIIDLYFTSPQTFLANHGYAVLEYIPGDASIYLYRLLLPVNVLCLQNYMATGMVVNFFSFLGGWFLFKTFLTLYPHLLQGAALSVLFFPSVLFWSSCGIMKDPITFGALGFLVYSVYWLTQNRKKLKNGLALLLFSWMLLVIKSYIFVTFAAGAVLWISLTLIGRIKIPALRKLVVLLSFLVILAGTFFFFRGEATQTSTDSASLINTDQALGIAAALKEQYALTEAGSSFQVDIEYTTGGLIRFFPTAMVISLFRPFLWESSNPIMLASAVEALFVLLFVLFLFIKRGLLFKLGTIFGNDRFLVLLLVFPLFFFFIIAMSTFNFGTLARYKIPALPFFVFLLYVLNAKTSRTVSAQRSKTGAPFSNQLT